MQTHLILLFAGQKMEEAVLKKNEELRALQDEFDSINDSLLEQQINASDMRDERDRAVTDLESMFF